MIIFFFKRIYYKKIIKLFSNLFIYLVTLINIRYLKKLIKYLFFNTLETEDL